LLFADLASVIDDNPTWGDASPVLKGTMYVCAYTVCSDVCHVNSLALLLTGLLKVFFHFILSNSVTLLASVLCMQLTLCLNSLCAVTSAYLHCHSQVKYSLQLYFHLN